MCITFQIQTRDVIECTFSHILLGCQAEVIDRLTFSISVKLGKMYIRVLKRQTHKPASFVDTSHKAGDGDDDNDGQKSSNLPCI